MTAQNQKCWICGGEANSEEHKIKSSDLRRHFGKRYSDENPLLYIKKDEPFVPLKNYKAKEVKFPKVICVECNNNRTKPHDNAYDEFVKYISENFEEMYSQSYINYFDVYGDDWKEKKKHLYRYYAKHAGCKIVTSDLPYDVSDLSEFILGENFTNTLKLKFRLSLPMKHLIEKKGFSNLHNGPTIYFGKEKSDINFGGWCSYQWISVFWVVSQNLDEHTTSKLGLPMELLLVKGLLAQNNPEKDIITQIEYQDLDSLEEQKAFYEEIMTSLF